jgi:tetrathionate reductase subunit A
MKELKMENNRRNFLIGSGAVVAAASIGGYKDTLGAVATLSNKGEKAKDSIYGNSLIPEAKIANDIYDKNSSFSIMSNMCNGCTTHCGVRVRIDNKTNKVVKVTGDPYNPLSTDPWLPYNTPLKDSYKILGKDSKENITFRSTACARGNTVFDKIDDPLRVTKPLKRVGKRGENRWEEIPIEQLIDEIVQGGNLFGEGNVEGLKSIRDIKTPLDPKDPSLGPKANQLCMLATGDDGRKKFAIHRFVKSFGTVNYQGHTSICGLAMRSGEAAYLGDFKKYPHLKPDFENCDYLLTFGTAPAQAGNPFKRQAKLLSKARTKKNLKYVVVAPMLTNADSIAVGNQSQWIPVKPGGDLAFVMGMLRVIIEEKLYNHDYLSLASKEAQKEANDASFTNASHLVIQDDEDFGSILKDKKEALVIDSEDGLLKVASLVKKAELFVDKSVEFNGKYYQVKSSMTLLKESANEYSLDVYSKNSGISKEKIIATAREFTSHGRKAAIDCHGGTMHTTGFYTTYAIMMLGAMVGNLNYQGGMSVGGGRYKDLKGKKYNLIAYKGKVKTKGYRVDKTRKSYEGTKEFKTKVANGQNPYPATDTWYPFTNALESEIITNSAKGYPYNLKAIISWNANILYGQSGTRFIKDLLADPKKSIPLFISIDPFINETSKYADYIVPDSVIYETWGAAGAWAGYQTKINMMAFPAFTPKQATFKNGEPICMDSFVIELGKKLGLPGFGKGAIKGAGGKKYNLDKPSDYYLRAFENVVLDGKPVPDISDEELKFANLESYVDKLKEISGDNWKKVAYAMARGGRYASKESGYKDGKLTHPYTKNCIQIYNPVVGKEKHAMTGERFSGVPRFYPARLNGGELLEKEFPPSKYPLSAFSYKSNVLSQCDASSSGMQNIRFTTYIDINPKSADKQNLKHGDMVKISSEGGSIEGMLRFRNGVMPDTLAIEHGLGRDAEGAETVAIGAKTFKGIVQRKTGVNINKLGILDPSRKLATLSDFVVGSNARQAIPVSITKI